MRPVIIIKIGGSILTYKKSSIPKLQRAKLEGIGKILKRLNEKYRLILIIGVGSFGHPVARKNKITEGLERNKEGVFQNWNKALEVHLKVADLANKVAEILLHSGIDVLPLSPFTQLAKKKFNFENIADILGKNLTPLLHGDVFFDDQKGVRVISGDELAAIIGEKFNAQQTFFITKGHGIYGSGDLSGNELKNSAESSKRSKSNLPFVKCSELKKILRLEERVNTDFDVTGGFLGKLKWCLKFIPVDGIRIINGTQLEDIENGLLKNEGGTLISND